MAAGALLLSSLAVAAQAASASVARGELLVTTRGHTGILKSTHVMALNIAQRKVYGGRSGKAFTVPDGRYALMAEIRDDGATDTIAETIVTVRGTGTTAVTLNGRGGRPVRVTLDGKPVAGKVIVTVCAGPAGTARVEATQGGGGELYVTPSASAEFSSGYTAIAKGVILTGAVARVPASLGGAWKASQTANITVTVRSGEQNAASSYYGLTRSQPGGECLPPAQIQIVGATVPYRVIERVTPGSWSTSTLDMANRQVGEYYLHGLRLAAGHSYIYTLYAAAWAPRGQLPDLRPDGIDFSPPVLAGPAGLGQETGMKSTFRLSLNGRQLAKRAETDSGNPADFFVSITKSGWYTLSDDASRYYPAPAYFPHTSGGKILSPRVTLSWRFYATPGTVGTDFQLIHGFWPFIQPTGLSITNSAAPRSTTRVAMRFTRPTTDTTNIPADSVMKVQSWFSTDGKTWKAVSVRHTGAGWTASVPNPASGSVSLRVWVTGSHGDITKETIYRAYTIG